MKEWYIKTRNKFGNWLFKFAKKVYISKAEKVKYVRHTKKGKRK